ncbi:hypothetical protein Sjap_008987 [Stephania japonica]|uniref:Uncharacterized protein n=1 Tax=Stephania japonica TaxID=461633 RepID=A0AAP0JS43_9MAGN
MTNNGENFQSFMPKRTLDGRVVGSDLDSISGQRRTSIVNLPVRRDGEDIANAMNAGVNSRLPAITKRMVHGHEAGHGDAYLPYF